VLILKSTTEMVAGGAGNAANNVAALGGRASPAWSAPTGRRRLLASFAHGVERGQITVPGPTRRRSRRASPACAARQQVVRSIAKPVGQAPT
jgi:bifunctional ADP-heptose synthase (sugar kinase/adenylyltransferase)